MMAKQATDKRAGDAQRRRMTVPRHVFLALGLTTALTPVAAYAQSNPFAEVVVFGDSLSDNGNLSIATGYGQVSRFTVNPGLVAFERVAAHYGLTLSPSLGGGTDYAYGGAGFIQNSPGAAPETAKIPAQMDSYLANHSKLDPRTLYAVLGGNNDILYHATAVIAGQTADFLVAQNTVGLSPSDAALVAAQIRAQVAAQADVAALETPTEALQGVLTSAQQEVALINRLGEAGATHILVANIPDIGLTPGAIAQGPSAEANLTALASAYNAQLNAGLAGRTDVIAVNTFALLREVASDPAHYGFTNITEPACTIHLFACTSATLVSPSAATSYFFADEIHPTPAGHATLADAMVSEIVAPGQMSLLASVPIALGREQRAVIDSELTSESRFGSDGVRLLATGQAGWRSLDGDLSAPKSRSHDTSATFGLVARRAALSVGAAVTFTHGGTELDGQAGAFRTKAVFGTAFGQYRWATDGWLSLQAGIGDVNIDDIQRSFMIGAAQRTERSATSANLYSVGVEAGRWFTVTDLRIAPFASLAYDHVKVGDIRERDEDATAMRFDAQHRDALAGKLGGKLAAEWSWREVVFKPSLTAAYGHDFQAGQGSVRAGLVTLNGQFDMPGYAPETNWGEIAARIDVGLDALVHAHLDYERRIGERSQETLASFGVSYIF